MVSATSSLRTSASPSAPSSSRAEGLGTELQDDHAEAGPVLTTTRCVRHEMSVTSTGEFGIDVELPRT